MVADVGTSTGILAFFAYQAGAKRVYAIEQREVIESAREIGKANGLEDRIVFINLHSHLLKALTMELST